jgi:F0F1-type ATP synthase assembly protein I
MDKKRRRGIIALLLVLSIGNFLRIDGYEQVKPLYLVSLLVIGILTGILLSDLMHLLRSRKEDKDKLI